MKAKAPVEASTVPIMEDKREGNRPEAPASPPPGVTPIREWWEQEATRIRAELDAFGPKPKAEDRWYALRLRGQLMKLYRLLEGKGAPTAPAAPKRATVGDLIRRAQAVPDEE